MSPPSRPPPRPRIPPSFAAKKSQILASLTQSADSYSDNSPKGSVDVQIRDLIREINGYEGLVTTSSCAGRVAVFVEGGGRGGKGGGGEGAGADGEGGVGDVEGGGEGGASGVWNNGTGSVEDLPGMKSTSAMATTTTSPGGKGGGRWLYVSHDPIPPPSSMFTATSALGTPQPDEQEHYSKLFHLPNAISNPSPPSSSSISSLHASSPPRLIHLSFSPLILHIHCATLQHARPLLAAAINAGFRESGVQSLRILDPSESERGVMVAVRTAGLGFESVVGVAAEEDESRREVLRTVVSEEYLGICAGVINRRFIWNEERRERFRRGLRGTMEREGFAAGGESGENVWEDKDERRRRNREEGLLKQQTKQKMSNENEKETGRKEDSAAGLDEDLSLLEIG